MKISREQKQEIKYSEQDLHDFQSRLFEESNQPD
jgi:hypothetical protein